MSRYNDQDSDTKGRFRSKTGMLERPGGGASFSKKVLENNSKNQIQWNPVNRATNGPPKIGRINGVAILTRKSQILEFKGKKLIKTS